MTGSIKSYLNENAIEISDFSIDEKQIAALIKIVDEGKVSNTIATQKIFPVLLSDTKTPEEIAKENNWIQESDSDALQEWVDTAVAKYPEKVAEYKGGKVDWPLYGRSNETFQGKADPKLANQLVKEALEK